MQTTEPPDATLALAESTYRAIKWRIIPFLVLCYIVAYIHRSNIGFAKLQFMHDLHISETAYGLGGGLFYLGYSFFQVPSNLLLAKFGARITMRRILILCGICSIAMAFIVEPIHFYVLRFMLGIAEAGFFPGVILYLSRWAPASQRARFTALFLAAIPLSGIVAGPISGTIMASTNHLAGLKGWQWLFLVEGVPTCILGLIAYYYLDETPADARWLTRTQKETLALDLAAEDRGNRREARSSFESALKDPRFYALGAMAMAAIAGSAAIGLWLPTVIRGTGIADMKMVGLLSSIPYCVAIVAQYLLARRSDRLRERRWHAAVSIFVSAAAWFLLPMAARTPWISVGLLTIAAMGTFAAAGPFWSMPAEVLSGSAAGGIAVVSTCGGIGAFVSPAIVGWANQRSHTLALGQWYYGILELLGGVLLVIGTRSSRHDRPASLAIGK